MKLYLALGFVFLAGCGASVNPTVDATSRITVEDAILKWGAPVYQKKTGDGGTLMVWRPRKEGAYQAPYVPPRGPTYGAAAVVPRGLTQGKIPYGSAKERQETLVLCFDRSGVVQHWDAKPR
jgi:hypothetical protein